MHNTGTPSVIIWGTGFLAEMARFYLDKNGLSVAAHILDSDYLSEDSFMGRPVVSPRELSQFPPTHHGAFVAIGYRSNNRLREEKCGLLEKMNYSLVAIRSPNSTVALSALPPNTLIMDGVILEPHVNLGKGNIFWSGSQVCHRSTVGDFNFFGPASLICGNVTIGSRNFFGAHCTVRDGITVENSTVIGASTYVKETIRSQTVMTESGTLPFRVNK